MGVYLKVKAPVLERALDDLSRFRALSDDETNVLVRTIRPRRRLQLSLDETQSAIVRNRREQGIPMTQIAQEIGFDYARLLRAWKALEGDCHG